jgi:hypothetical protein
MQRNRTGNMALVLSALGLWSLFVFSSGPLTWILPWTSLICPVGLLLGILGLQHPPRRTAWWAVAIGLWGSLCLPTIWIFYLRAW